MDPIDQSESDAFCRLLARLFGTQALQWAVTVASYDAFAQLVVTSGQSLKAIELVPRPLGFTGSFRWAHKATRRALIDFHDSIEGRAHLHRMKAAAAELRSTFEQAHAARY